MKKQTLVLFLVGVLSSCMINASQGRLTADDTKKYLLAYVNNDQNAGFVIDLDGMKEWCNRCAPEDAYQTMQFDDGSTALHHFVMKDAQELVNYVATKGANFNAVRNNDGKTPLQLQADLMARSIRNEPAPQPLIMSFVGLNLNGAAPQRIVVGNPVNQPNQVVQSVAHPIITQIIPNQAPTPRARPTVQEEPSFLKKHGTKIFGVAFVAVIARMVFTHMSTQDMQNNVQDTTVTA